MSKVAARGAIAALSLAVLLLSQDPARAGSRDIPTTGQALPQFAGVDAVITSMMTRFGIHGAGLGIMHDGRLVYLRGYGYANIDTGDLVQPNSRFRIASISKDFTAVSIMSLVEQGRLSLDTPVFPLLNIPPPPGATVDPRIYTITVKQILQHQGGWDAGQTFDPMSFSVQAARTLGLTPPGDCATIIRWMLGFPLQFDPGTRSAYSNFGYCVLGRVIEKVSGMSYGQYVRQTILGPLTMTGTDLAHSLTALPGEVHYYDLPPDALYPSVFDGTPVPGPYGAFYMEADDSCGGWVSSASDLLRYLATMNGLRGKLLQHTWQDFGLGFGVIPPTGDGWVWLAGGAGPGNRALLALDGKDAWAVILNTSPTSGFDQADPMYKELAPAVKSIQDWPAGDLFPTTAPDGYGYSLTVTATGSGKVTSDPAAIDCPGTCNSRIPLGTTLALKARPDVPASRFLGWSGACTGMESCSFTVRGDTHVEANFGPVEELLRASITGAGRIISAPGGISCPKHCLASFPYGTRVTLVAAASRGWHFRSWSGACSGRKVTCARSLQADAAVRATFTRDRR